MQHPRRITRLLLATIAAMMIGLVGLVFFIQSAVARIDVMNRTIAEDAVPSIIAIESTTAAISELRALLREQLRAPGGRDVPIAQTRAEIATSAGRYLGSPAGPGEADIMNELRQRLARLDELTGRIAAVPADEPGTARDRLRDELDKTASEIDRTLIRASRLNAELERSALAQARAVSKRLLPGALVFEAASLLAAAVAVLAAQHLSVKQAALTAELARINEELEAFSGRVAHDLLSPLMTVSLTLGFAERCAESTGDERLRTNLARAASTLERVRRTTSDLLDFARSGAAPIPARTPVAPLLEGVVRDLEPIATESGVDLRLASTSARAVACTEGVLSSVISNLVENSIRYTKGAVERRVEVRAVDAGPEVRFEIEDTGPGIRPEDREAIFEPYVRRSDAGPGLGLGLATVKRLAESRGGHVGVESERGHGALFWVTLPVAA